MCFFPGSPRAISHIASHRAKWTILYFFATTSVLGSTLSLDCCSSYTNPISTMKHKDWWRLFYQSSKRNRLEFMERLVSSRQWHLMNLYGQCSKLAQQRWINPAYFHRMPAEWSRVHFRMFRSRHSLYGHQRSGSRKDRKAGASASTSTSIKSGSLKRNSAQETRSSSPGESSDYTIDPITLHRVKSTKIANDFDSKKASPSEEHAPLEKPPQQIKVDKIPDPEQVQTKEQSAEHAPNLEFSGVRDYRRMPGDTENGPAESVAESEKLNEDTHSPISTKPSNLDTSSSNFQTLEENMVDSRDVKEDSSPERLVDTENPPAASEHSPVDSKTVELPDDLSQGKNRSSGPDIKAESFKNSENPESITGKDLGTVSDNLVDSVEAKEGGTATAQQPHDKPKSAPEISSQSFKEQPEYPLSTEDLSFAHSHQNMVHSDKKHSKESQPRAPQKTTNSNSNPSLDPEKDLFPGLKFDRGDEDLSSFRLGNMMKSLNNSSRPSYGRSSAFGVPKPEPYDGWDIQGLGKSQESEGPGPTPQFQTKIQNLSRKDKPNQNWNDSSINKLEDALRKSKEERDMRDNEQFRVKKAFDYSWEQSHSKHPRSLEGRNFFTSVKHEKAINEKKKNDLVKQYAILTPSLKTIYTGTLPFKGPPPQDLFSALSTMENPEKYVKSISKLEKNGWKCIGGGGKGELLVFERQFSPTRKYTRQGLKLAFSFMGIVGSAAVLMMLVS